MITPFSTSTRLPCAHYRSGCHDLLWITTICCHLTVLAYTHIHVNACVYVHLTMPLTARLLLQRATASPPPSTIQLRPPKRSPCPPLSCPLVHLYTEKRSEPVGLIAILYCKPMPGQEHSSAFILRLGLCSPSNLSVFLISACYKFKESAPQLSI